MAAPVYGILQAVSLKIYVREGLPFNMVVKQRPAWEIGKSRGHEWSQKH